MAQATSTTLGQIVLAGDLFGNDANSVSLVQTGVEPGAVSPLAKCHIDAKGRLTWTGPIDYTVDVESHIPSATVSTKGAFVVGRNIEVSSGEIFINNASSSVHGVFGVGNNLEINQSTGAIDAVVPDASASSRGVFQVGANFDISNGVLSRTGYGFASQTVKGMVKPGTTFDISNGVLSVPFATTTTAGVASIDNYNLYLDIADNRLYCHAANYMLWGLVYGISSDFYFDETTGALCYTSPYGVSAATESAIGSIKIGSGFYVNSETGELSTVTDATTSVKGVVEASDNIQVTGGVISIANGSSGNYGCVCVGDSNVTLMAYNTTPITNPGFPDDGTTGLRFRRCDTAAQNLNYPGVVRTANQNNVSIVNGNIDLGVNIAKKNSVGTFTKAQVVAKSAFVDVDWSRGNNIELSLTGNITSVPAPTNAVPGQIMNLYIRQDATGGRTITGWNSVYKFNSTLTLSTAPNSVDIITIICKSSTEFYVLFNKGYI